MKFDAASLRGFQVKDRVIKMAQGLISFLVLQFHKQSEQLEAI
jgi:hypothetical protein